MKKPLFYVIPLIIVIVVGLTLRGHWIEINYEFNGLVQKITFDEPKHTPTIIVNGKSYTFVYNNRFLLDSVSVGDSVIKVKGENEMHLFKK